MKETPRANSHNHFDTHRSTELASSDSRCFEMLAKFGNSCSKSIEDYCPSSCLAIEVLERKHLEMIARWLASSGSTTLLVDVENERCGPSWATDFVLEMVDIFKPANGGSQVSFGALVTHYCRTENSMNYGEEGVLQVSSITLSLHSACFLSWRAEVGDTQSVLNYALPLVLVTNSN